MNISYNFLKKNFLIYLFNSLSIIFTYILIIICFHHLDKENFFVFTGFIAILNIFIIPINSMSIGLSRLDKREYFEQINKIFYGLLFLTLIFTLINFTLYDILNINNLLKMSKNHLFFLILITFSYSIYNLNISKYLKEKKYERYSFSSFLPFFIRVFLLIFTIIYFKKINFNHIIFIYLVSFLYFFNFKIIFKKKYFLFYKKNFFLKKEFINNFLSISIITLILNLDILIARNVNIEVSNDYYIASLYAKILILSSVFIMPYIYKLNLKSKIEFKQIATFNLLINISLIIFYYFYLTSLHKILFQNTNIDQNLVLKICFFCLIFSISLNISNRVSIITSFHLIAKFILLIIFILIFIFSTNITINILIEKFSILSICFLFVDFFFYLKNFSTKLNLK